MGTLRSTDSLLKMRARAAQSGNDKGFILIVVVGMLAVLVVLGLSYAEQGRVELLGASNSRDLSAMDGLAESGFQIALRALHDDQNVTRSGYVPAHLASLGGFGWTSRWGYNPDAALGGALPSATDRAPSRSQASNYQDSWRMLFWNEETVEPVATWTGKAWGYGFKFRPGNDDQAKRSMETQRYPQPVGVLLDTVQLQPFARVRKFRVQVGASFGLIQVGITAKDGGLNLNDVFDPGTVAEKPGVYETLPSGSLEGTVGLGAPYEISPADTRVPAASPDRRSLEFILGRPPQWANKFEEQGHYYSYRFSTMRYPSGSAEMDNGLYNWRHFFEPYGGFRAYSHSGGPGQLWIYNYPGYANWPHQRASTGFLTAFTSGAPTTVWNVAGGAEPNRYGMEPSRFPMWLALKGMAFTDDGTYKSEGVGYLIDPQHYGNDVNKDYLWFPSGLWKNDPRLPGTTSGTGRNDVADQLFQGFGFDRFNAPRAGIDAVGSDFLAESNYYIGAGAYGHPKARTFQLHFVNAVAQGRFWTDLLAAWYFGGAPGYTNFLGSTQSSGYNNWAHLGSSYDSLGVGTHWMPPTSHVWLPGFFSKGSISTPTTYQKRGANNTTNLPGKDELSRGMTRWPGNMPPARMAASYVVPMARWPADFVGQSNAHFSFNNFRLMIRAHGIQENWGDPLAPGAVNGNASANRWYDAVDINNSNFPIIYGLLTPEKMPSMVARTVVAPHLHWKARMLDVECRLQRPVKIDGTAEAYDDVKNSWIPVQIGLRTPDAAKTYPGADWDSDPDSGSYNPWIPLRMKLNDPSKPWNPDSASPNYNVWVEPKLLHPGQAYDPITNPFYNSAAFLAELNTTEAVRHDFIKYPWMPSLKDPVIVVGGVDHIKYGLYGFDNPELLAYVAAGNTDWSQWIQDEAAAPTGSVSIANFPYMPIDSYGVAPTWKSPGPFDGADVPYSNPGWEGYLFEPRWYTGRTVNPKFLGKELLVKNGADAVSIAAVGDFVAQPGKASGGGTSMVQSASEPANAWDFTAHATDMKLEGGLGAMTCHRHVDPDRPNVVWGKMDFLLPEPKEYLGLNGDLVGYGTGRPMDDVFLDAYFDCSLHEYANTGRIDSFMVRPDRQQNWPEWFAQRKRAIPAQAGGVDKTLHGVKDADGNVELPYYRPETRDSGGELEFYGLLMEDGKLFDNPDPSTGVAQWDPELTSIGSQIRRVVRAASVNTFYYWDGTAPQPDVKPHPTAGLPNPSYMFVYPGGPVSQHWADQFRRYFPVQLVEIDEAGNPYDDPDNKPETMANNPYPGAMPPGNKLVDDPQTNKVRLDADGKPVKDLNGNPIYDPVPAATMNAVDPTICVPRTHTGEDDTPAVPAVGKDEAWRITRAGPRYQEVIANELMDYQINPWWPNPCVPVSELCVPLDKQTYPSEPRAKVKVEALTGRNRWRSYAEHMTGNETTVGARVPKYYAYFNRFWTRTNHKAVRNWAGDPNAANRPLGEPYRAISIAGNAAAGIPDELLNATEGKGMYPPTWQYFGQFPPAEATFQDRIKDFPYNVMEDQLGDDWRYLAKSVSLMTEPQMQLASGRNHPFRNWADFVAFLGHLVYRAPLDPKATPQLSNANTKAVRSVLDGVDAWAVCHGTNADARNQGKFFDGSKIRVSSAGAVNADCLRSPIVAKEGFWPIVANYGRAPDAGSDPYYPNVPSSGGWNAKEWNRRWDEIRGRDEAGLRVEQHYISERAANDVLVCLSNGRIGPIDFDGDGHVVMTRAYGKDISKANPGTRNNPLAAGAINEVPNAKPSGDIPQQRIFSWWTMSAKPSWQLPYGYPWHGLTGNDSIVEFEEFDDEPTYDATFANRDFWDTDANPLTMNPENIKLGILPQADARLWRKAQRRDIIQNCVTMPIKFHSNTFRITVVVEITDAQYKDVYGTRRFQKVLSRIPDTSTGAVHGPLTGEFIEHSSRAMNGADPELSWLGVK